MKLMERCGLAVGLYAIWIAVMLPYVFKGSHVVEDFSGVLMIASILLISIRSDSEVQK